MIKKFNLKKFRFKLVGVFKWLYPGIGIKRWIGLSSFGVVLVAVGSNHLRTDEYWLIQLLDEIIIISGVIILILGIKRMTRSFIAAFLPSSKDVQLVDILFRRKSLSQGPQIVAVGGGTGLSCL